VNFDSYDIIEYNEDCITVMHTWDIFSKWCCYTGRFRIFNCR
jgi:hypothetical protein